VTIRVHVERLVLEGLELTHAERGTLERAMVSELTRLLVEAQSNPWPSGSGESGAFSTRQGAQVTISPGQPTAAFGAQVAGSVYGAVIPQRAPRERGGK
jgi:hypothetical protein